MLWPAFAPFAAAYAEGRAQVVWTRLVADLETPVSAYLKVAGAKKAMSFLLESVEGGAARGRYSVIGLEPDLIWRAHGETAEINRTPLNQRGRVRHRQLGTLQSLRALLAESAITLPEGLPPMSAGIFGYMGYDTVRLIEQLPEMTPDALGVPDAILIRPTLILIFDSVKDEMTVVTPVRPAPGHQRARGIRRCADASRSAPSICSMRRCRIRPRRRRCRQRCRSRNRTRRAAEYLGMVAKAKEYIKAGDIFQVVLSQRFSAPFALPSIRALSLAAPFEPVAVFVPSRFRQFRAGRIEPGNSGARARRRRHHPPDCRHRAARRKRRPKTSTGGRLARRSERTLANI